MKKYCLIILCLLFSIPAFAGTRSFMEKCLNSWLGYSIDSLINVWGYPNNEKEIAGKHIYIWNKSNTAYIPQSSYTNGNVNTIANTYGNSIYGNSYINSTTTTYGGYNVTYYCNRIIEVDEDNKIINWQWEGNNCPGTYIRGKKWVNPKNDEWAQKKSAKKSNSKNTIIYEYKEK